MSEEDNILSSSQEYSVVFWRKKSKEQNVFKIQTDLPRLFKRKDRLGRRFNMAGILCAGWVVRDWDDDFRLISFTLIGRDVHGQEHGANGSTNQKTWYPNIDSSRS